MKKLSKQLLVQCGILFLLLILPMAGLYFSGKFIPEYLEFPSHTHYVRHAPFSLPVFIGLAVFIAAFVLPFIIKVISSNFCELRSKPITDNRLPVTGRRSWPWWGSIGIVFGVLAWILAWNRFAWFADFQIFTFTPFWISYIIVINAWTQKRTGKCMMLNTPKFFGILFFLSAFFWWFFEYLNRFVQNWY